MLPLGCADPPHRAADNQLRQRLHWYGIGELFRAPLCAPVSCIILLRRWCVFAPLRAWSGTGEPSALSLHIAQYICLRLVPCSISVAVGASEIPVGASWFERQESSPSFDRTWQTTSLSTISPVTTTCLGGMGL